MAKRQSKSGSKKKRKKGRRGPGEGEEQEALAAGGMIQAFRGGMKRAVGTADEEIEERAPSWRDHFWTILLVVVVIGVLIWRFGMN